MDIRTPYKSEINLATDHNERVDDKSCYVYFHFPFDLGFNIGDDGFERLYDIAKEL